MTRVQLGEKITTNQNCGSCAFTACPAKKLGELSNVTVFPDFGLVDDVNLAIQNCDPEKGKQGFVNLGRVKELSVALGVIEPNAAETNTIRAKELLELNQGRPTFMGSVSVID